ncbi:hypothetical protein NTGHW29_370031 [Candidatus Nitrotoga sp. HW29]|nr:hypothetical protein NTGHW29_370031 [Candidatus Nitrotoga sp. HW29]
MYEMSNEGRKEHRQNGHSTTRILERKNQWIIMHFTSGSFDP